MSRPKVVRFFVFVGAIMQIVMAYVVNIADSATITDPQNNLIITPAAYAFGIWGLITTGTLLYGLHQLLARQRNADLYDAIAPHSVGLFAGFSVWLVAASLNWLWLTVAIILSMGTCLYRLYPLVLTSRLEQRLSRYEVLIVYGTFGVYAGWITVAIFANVGSAIKYSGFSDVTAGGLVGQGAILVGALVVSCLLVRRFRAPLPYTLTLLWAYVAIFINALSRRTEAGALPHLALVAIVSVLVVSGATMSEERRRISVS